MAGAGIELKLDDQYQVILDALSRASMPKLREVADFAGAELDVISKKAFTDQADPVSGRKWKPLKYPRIKQRGKKAGTEEWGPVLNYGGQLKRSLNWESFGDGSVIFGSNMVYARIHQEGGRTQPHAIRPYQAKALRFNGRFAARVNHPGSDMPARPYMGAPKDFDRRILTDPAVLKFLGLQV
jgi:phage gpG-like protein